MLKAFSQCLIILTLPFSMAVQGANVLFINPGLADETFWVSYSDFMQAAANSLGMQLEVQYAQRSPQKAIEQARAALQGPHRPDYLVFVNEQYVAPQILRLSHGSGVKLFMVNNGLTQEQAQLMETDGARYSGWLGSMVTNDEEGGYLMLSELIRQHGPIAPGQTVDLLAFSGVKNTPASRWREKGMQRALNEHPHVRLRQMVYGEWNEQRAYEQAQQLFKRYPDTALVWSANDEMAFGAMRAAEETGRKPGRDLLFSAVNNSIPALQARIDGRLSVLVAGHFTLGGWAMVLLNDASKGVDFTRFGGRDRQVPLLRLLDAKQATTLLNITRSRHYDLPFTAFSAQGKPPSYQYPFTLDTLLQLP
ncbi:MULTISPECIES: ABC transporter substrate-binding protein [Pseudomonas]|uniref:LacI family transcriptional regulator n=1 Tax=Pseudomonas lundensis TaxID=86185 RepID=A0A266N902_9PSED|nr:MULTISPECIES: ABC transporter substrate-binding protein [Pseudomonas]NMY36424.1 substrate-binding domain-containing protein [Pseudomonas sp. WS 5078]NMY59165.1 substrate-binding domain-containing protein [Pseudomonas sp. WS 5354]OZY58275.1 LacI family transcriptional regulator [Pseudomonas lundensis]